MLEERNEPLAKLRHEARSWRIRALVSWLALAGVVLATCANYTATDDLVARRKLTVGKGNTRVHVENGVITITGADGSNAVLDASGLTLRDGQGKPTATFQAKP